MTRAICSRIAVYRSTNSWARFSIVSAIVVISWPSIVLAQVDRFAELALTAYIAREVHLPGFFSSHAFFFALSNRSVYDSCCSCGPIVGACGAAAGPASGASVP